MQAVPLGASAANTEGGHCPSAYEWSEHLSDGTLLAVGGRRAIHRAPVEPAAGALHGAGELDVQQRGKPCRFS